MSTLSSNFATFVSGTSLHASSSAYFLPRSTFAVRGYVLLSVLSAFVSSFSNAFGSVCSQPAPSAVYHCCGQNCPRLTWLGV